MDTHKLKDPTKTIIHRLRIAKGHLNKVLKMVEEKEYCIDIINQSKAVQSALKEVDNLILDNHLRTCVVDKLNKGEVGSTIEEVIKVYKSKS